MNRRISLFIIVLFLISCGRPTYDKEPRDREENEVPAQVQEEEVSITPYPVSDATMQELTQFMQDLKSYKQELTVSYRLLMEESKDMQDILRRESMGYLAYSVDVLIELTNELISLLKLETVHGEHKQFDVVAINEVIQPLISDIIEDIDSEIEVRSEESEVGHNPFFRSQIKNHLKYLNRFKKILDKIVGEFPPLETSDENTQTNTQEDNK